MVTGDLVTGGNLTLRPQSPADAEALNQERSEFNDFGPRPEREGQASPRFEDDRGGLTVDVDGQVAGSVSWIWKHHGPNQGSRCIMIGIELLPEFHGRGLGTRAQRELVEQIFRHTVVHRIEAHTDVTNRAEQRSLEKAGFQREGVIRGGQWRAGQYRDGVLFSILRPEL